MSRQLFRKYLQKEKRCSILGGCLSFLLLHREMPDIRFAPGLKIERFRFMSVEKREQFASRLGFILMTAGCAIGLGNVWRFPYVAGANGGGIFVLLYLFFLVVLGFPLMMMELSVGRAGKCTLPGAMRALQRNKNAHGWFLSGRVLFTGNLILLMFYTVVTGWLLAYACYFVSGRMDTVSAAETSAFFGSFLASPGRQVLYTFISLGLMVAVCIGGIRKSIEKSIKIMMMGLCLLLLVLLCRALSLENAAEGVKFFLKPDFSRVTGAKILPVIHAAMAQAFFTLSLGIGSIVICGSYINREKSLPGEGLWIILLDTSVAVISGLIIFPCCAAFGVAPDAGPSLIFITLPPVFQNMSGGFFWGTLFFVFLFIAAFSTLVAVFENLVAFGIDEFGVSRRKSAVVAGLILAVASLPCVFGFNLWRKFQPFGEGSNVLDLEDFLVSDNLLPLGTLVIALFCTRNYGWGIENFYREVNTGSGRKLPHFIAPYLCYVLPLTVFVLWALGIIKKFDLF